MKSFAIRAPEELIEGFRVAAAADERSFSAELRHLMREHVARSQKDERPAREPTPVTTPAAGAGERGTG